MHLPPQQIKIKPHIDTLCHEWLYENLVKYLNTP